MEILLGTATEGKRPKETFIGGTLLKEGVYWRIYKRDIGGKVYVLFSYRGYMHAGYMFT